MQGPVSEVSLFYDGGAPGTRSVGGRRRRRRWSCFASEATESRWLGVFRRQLFCHNRVRGFQVSGCRCKQVGVPPRVE